MRGLSSLWNIRNVGEETLDIKKKTGLFSPPLISQTGIENHFLVYHILRQPLLSVMTAARNRSTHVTKVCHLALHCESSMLDSSDTSAA